MEQTEQPKCAYTHAMPFCDGFFLEKVKPFLRPTDVFVTTTAKTGQTWLMNLLNQLKIGGKEDPEDLLRASPWLENRMDLERGTNEMIDEDTRIAHFETLPDPRVFKMHVAFDDVPTVEGSKIITITRDPRDVPYSMFQHMKAMKQEIQDSMKARGREIDDWSKFADEWIEEGHYWKSVASYWNHKDDPNFLMLRYEDLKKDLRSETMKLISFLEWDLGTDDEVEALVDRALPLVDFGYMKQHQWTTLFPKTKGVFDTNKHFVREGKVGSNRQHLTEEQQQRIVTACREHIGDEATDFLLSD